MKAKNLMAVTSSSADRDAAAGGITWRKFVEKSGA